MTTSAPTWFAAGWCQHCGDPFVAIKYPGEMEDRYCSRACAKAAAQRRYRARRSEQAAARTRARRADARDKPGLHDLRSWQRTYCTECGKRIFPMLERAMFAACLMSVSLRKPLRPYYTHGHWHLTSQRTHRSGREARLRMATRRRAEKRRSRNLPRAT